MEKRIAERINELFTSYDLFSNAGIKRNRNKMTAVIPDITETEIKELEAYLQDFYQYCSVYGNQLARKYKAPCLPDNDKARQEINHHVRLCQEKYAEIDEKHILDLFNTICWLTNR